MQREILGRLADGRLPAGLRINESHLAADLGLSRTPLREAMLTLAAAGFLDSDMGRGFLVPPLAAGEFREIQAVLQTLQPLALSLTPPLPGDRLMQLANLLGRARTPAGGGRLPDPLPGQWSALVLQDCGNRLLAADIARLEGLARRYWHAAGQAGLTAHDLLASLQELYELLRGGRREQAATHWAGHVARFGAAAAEVLARG